MASITSGGLLEDVIDTGLEALSILAAPAGRSPVTNDALPLFVMCAYSLLSVAGSFRVTQYAHQLNTVYTNVPAKGVHVVIPRSVFTADKAVAVSRAIRSGA